MDAKERRKRKDPQSRDFACLCGKSYLSYAAAYTHAKNKHQGDKTYLDGIKKPEREQLKRGRPKEKKESKLTAQTAKLTLIESTILKICEQLQGVFPHAVLQGNQERDPESYEQHYRSLFDQHKKTVQDIDFKQKEQDDFVKSLIKDFNSQVAARVRFACQILSSQEHALSTLALKLNACNLWHSHEVINDIIWNSLKQWRRTLQVPAATEQQNILGEVNFDIDQ